MDGLPRGMSEYDRFLAVNLHGGATLAATVAQRIEQGIGRAARGSGDYCVVFLVGRDLSAWVGRSANSKALTSSTRAQLTIGQEVSRDVEGADDMFETVRRCLKRDKEWTEYHAEMLAELAETNGAPLSDLAQATLERGCLRLWREGHSAKAYGKIAVFVNERGSDLDRYSAGWLMQLAARIAHSDGKSSLAQGYQKDAYAKNTNLLRPQAGIAYERLGTPGKQAERMVRQVVAYKPRRAFMSHFEEIAAHLTGNASSNQFEEALRELGHILGFEGQRPERTYGIGPDVIWLLGSNPPTGWVIEVKSRKTEKLILDKDDHGQLLTAEQWFQSQYSGYSSVRVSVLPKAVATPNASAGETKALTLTSLQELIAEARELLGRVVEVDEEDDMVGRADKLLRSSHLRPERMLEAYLETFTTATK
jgi:Holliday junction resolvase